MNDRLNHKNKFEKRYTKIIEENKLKLSKRNIDLLIDFFKLLQAEGLTFRRQYKYLVQLPQMFQYINKDFLDWDKETLIEFAGLIRQKDYAEKTKLDFLGIVKKIYKTITIIPKYEYLDKLYIWVYDRRNRYYSTHLKGEKNKLKEEWLNDTEVKLILEKAHNLRDRAMLSLFASQGMRPGELFTLRKCDIEKVTEGIKLEISGKTGVRQLFIYEGYVINNLLEYVKTLPNDQELVFKLTDRRANDILKELCEELGIKKRVYLYKLRKFSVTKDRILGMSTGALESKYGWTKGSNRVKFYDKSTSIDYRRESKEMAGRQQMEKPKNKFGDQKCLRCNELNPYHQSYCSKCGTRLDINREDLEGRTEIDKALNQLMEDMEFKSFLMKKLKEMN